uniref:Uncharacterized protein n=1 Tax=Arundo donax TaxID=35708 RepID=A0A0A8YYX7_ARUDO
MPKKNVFFLIHTRRDRFHFHRCNV